MTETVCSSVAGRDAELVFRAAIRAIRGDVLVRNAASVSGDELSIVGSRFRLKPGGRIVVIGAGKAAGRMAAGLIGVLSRAGVDQGRITGWINVPDDGVVSAPPLTVLGCRPAGENLPTSLAIGGTREIIRLVRDLGPDDLGLCLISGGGSALLSLPAEGVSLDDKRQLIRWLDASGATIEVRNRIRRELSQVKGGRLAQIQTGGTLVTLVISDILGDPLELIASGPTVPTVADRAGARKLLEGIASKPGDFNSIPRPVWDFLQRNERPGDSAELNLARNRNVRQQTFLIGNLGTSVQAAAEMARSLGYQVETRIQTDANEQVSTAANRLARWVKESGPGPRMMIDGGEPVVRLSANPGRGGRNQQLVLEAAHEIMGSVGPQQEYCLLSGGTDGEDGNTPVAGGLFDHRMIDRWIQHGVKPYPYLARNDAYSFFEQFQGLLSTGSTGTNVGDLRIAAVR